MRFIKHTPKVIIVKLRPTLVCFNRLVSAYYSSRDEKIFSDTCQVLLYVTEAPGLEYLCLKVFQVIICWHFNFFFKRFGFEKLAQIWSYKFYFQWIELLYFMRCLLRDPRFERSTVFCRTWNQSLIFCLNPVILLIKETVYIAVTVRWKKRRQNIFVEFNPFNFVEG